MLRVVWVMVLAWVLTACTAVVGPPHGTVEGAIALQFSQTQEALVQLLDPEAKQFPPFTISNVKVTDQQPLSIQNLRSYRVRGTYTVTLELPQRRVIQRDSPFEVYLQRQIEGKTWRLARRSPEGEEGWVTQLVM